VDLVKSTPFMDQLAADGIKLTNYYTEFECTPSRASLMTGRYPISLGMQHECITPFSEWGLPKTETTMADVFSKCVCVCSFHVFFIFVLLIFIYLIMYPLHVMF
jgi:arylsulfatase A-like enzyme